MEEFAIVGRADMPVGEVEERRMTSGDRKAAGKMERKTWKKAEYASEN